MVKAESHPAGFTKTDRGFLALILIFIASLILLTPRIYSGDEIQYYAYLRSLWKDHGNDINRTAKY